MKPTEKTWQKFHNVNFNLFIVSISAEVLNTKVHSQSQNFETFQW